MEKRRRRRYDAARRLTVTGAVTGTEAVPPRRAWLSRPLQALVGALPTHEESGRGRATAGAIRLALGLTAIWFIVQGKGSWVMAAIGVTVGLTMVVVPLAESRKRRWLAGARRLSEGGAIAVQRPAELDYDGAKLTITSEDRVWRSLRVRVGPCEPVVGVMDARVFLGLLTPRRREKALWFVAPRGEVEGRTWDPVEATAGFDAGAVDPADVVTVDGEAWAALHEALWDPKLGGVPTARGPTEVPKQR